jgi:hypothetical protein
MKSAMKDSGKDAVKAAERMRMPYEAVRFIQLVIGGQFRNRTVKMVKDYVENRFQAERIRKFHNIERGT